MGMTVVVRSVYVLRSVCTPVCMTVEYPWLYTAAQLHYYYDLWLKAKFKAFGQ